MKAVQIHRYGSADVLRYEDAPIPTPDRGEVLIRVHGAGINPVDCKTRAGQGMAWKFGGNFPLIMGWDVAGVVESVNGRAPFAVGDRVYGMLNFPDVGSAYAEYAVANPMHIARAPSRIDLQTASALPLVALTAWQALFEIGKLAAGERVLIHAAAGGVGHIAVQMAKWKGAYVIGTASAHNFEYLQGLGVDELIDYTKERFETKVKNVDLVLNTVSPDISARSLDTIRPGGRLVSIVGQAPSKRGIETQWMLVRPHSGQLAEIAALVDSGSLTPTIERVLPLASAVEAHRLVEGRHVRGKVVLDASPS